LRGILGGRLGLAFASDHSRALLTVNTLLNKIIKNRLLDQIVIFLCYQIYFKMSNDFILEAGVLCLRATPAFSIHLLTGFVNIFMF
jgi:hypothetical protein